MERLHSDDPNTLGNWTLLQRLGEGGFGTVYLAEQNGSRAAIKVLKLDPYEPEHSIERFRLEAEALTRLRNPCIARVLEVALDASPPWIATEFIYGQTLEDLVRFTDNHRIEGDAWLRIAANLFNALKAAHASGVIHKDVKPSNVIITENGSGKLIDFGLAHVSGFTRSLQFGDFEGSRPFSSPESYRAPEAAMDVFSAAATLAYAAKGTLIWNGKTEEQLLRNVLYDEPDLTGLTVVQQDILRPLLNKRAAERPTAAEVETLVLELLEDTVPDSASKRLGAWRKRFVQPSKRLSMLRVGAATVPLVALVGFIISQSPSFDLTRQAPTGGSSVASAVPVATSSLEKPSEAGTLAAPSSAATQTSSSRKPGSASYECEKLWEKGAKATVATCLVAADAGDVPSIYYLASAYRINGQLASAEKWALLGAARGDVHSMRLLAMVYEDLGNNGKRVTWLKACADRGDAYCLALYGVELMAQGSIEQGIPYLRDAYDAGNIEAATSLGRGYYKLGDNANALKWLTKAAEGGSTLGRDELIRVAFTLKKMDVYLLWLTKAASDGNKTYQTYLATYYLDKQQYEDARNWAQKAATAGSVQATGILGIILYKFDKNPAGAKPLLLKAAEGGDAPAMGALADLYQVSEKNYVEALKWYKKASQAGVLYATYGAAVLYAGGFGDEASACTWFKATLQQAGTQLRLGDLSEAEASSWTYKAQEGITATCGTT